MYDTLFLDRDGVINYKLENRYVTRASEFKFIVGAENAIKKLSKVFNRILIVTNQQGISKGIMSENNLETIHQFMQNQLSGSEKFIEKIYFCPHLASYSCNCRKPNIGMLEQAKIDFPLIDISKSYLVGDSDTDIAAGKRFGLKTVKVDSVFTLAHWSKSIL